MKGNTADCVRLCWLTYMGCIPLCASLLVIESVVQSGEGVEEKKLGVTPESQWDNEDSRSGSKSNVSEKTIIDFTLAHTS